MAVKPSARINLLSEEMIRPRVGRLAGLLVRVGYVVLGIYVVGLLGLIGTGVVLGFQRSKLEGIKSLLVSDVDALAGEEEAFRLLKNRVGFAKGVVADSSSSPAIVEDFLSSSVSSVSTIGEVKAGDGGVKVDVTASDPKAVLAVLSILLEKQYSFAGVDGIGLAGGGAYALSIFIK